MGSFKNFCEDEETRKYKLTAQDKKDVKELLELWDNLKYNMDVEIETFELDHIYQNDIAYYRMQKVRRDLVLVKEMKKLWDDRSKRPLK